jgi:F-type H+-transporting ATPase subunit delta
MASLRSFSRSLIRLAEASGSAGKIPSKLKLNLLAPHEAVCNGANVDMVIVPGVAGDFGVLPGHIPTIAGVRAGVVAVHNEKDVQRYFVSAGFAAVHQDSTTDICVGEAVEIGNIDIEAVRKNLNDVRQAQTSAKSEVEKAEAQIAIDVLSAMELAVTGSSSRA